MGIRANTSEAVQKKAMNGEGRGRKVYTSKSKFRPCLLRNQELYKKKRARLEGGERMWRVKRNVLLLHWHRTRRAVAGKKTAAGAVTVSVCRRSKRHRAQPDSLCRLT